VDGALRHSQRLQLRRPEPRDEPFVIDLFSRPAVVAHRPVTVPDSAEASRARLSRDIGHWTEHGFGRWAAEADGSLVGFGGVTRSADFDALNLSYHIHPDHWGRGYATELAREAVTFAFTELGAQRIVGLARPANPASRRVLERVGFIYERNIDLHGAPTMLFIMERDYAI
jgi:RimJ/RimL family protein N-acetyltransferase